MWNPVVSCRKSIGSMMFHSLRPVLGTADLDRFERVDFHHYEGVKLGGQREGGSERSRKKKLNF